MDAREDVGDRRTGVEGAITGSDDGFDERGGGVLGPVREDGKLCGVLFFSVAKSSEHNGLRRGVLEKG